VTSGKKIAWVRWPTGAPSAALAYDEIQRVAAKHRSTGCRAEWLLKAAESKDNPLHGVFDWSNTSAARKWRLYQARQLIINLRVVVIPDAKKPDVKIVVRAMELTTKGNEAQNFKPIDVIMSDENQRRQVLTRAREELRIWIEKYGSLKQFAKLVPVIRRYAG
jgi:hypothetical protein